VSFDFSTVLTLGGLHAGTLEGSIALQWENTSVAGLSLAS
jgi:hypothetical protein